MKQGPDDLQADSRLAQRAALEPEAFGQIYDRFYPMILNYTFRRTMNAAAAEELTSNTFFKALRAIPKFQSGRPLRAWLYAIATNELRMHWRWRKRHPALSSRNTQPVERVVFASEATDREDVEEKIRDFARLHSAMDRLPHRYQAILALRYFEELSFEQVAAVLGIPMGTVKSRLHRATAKLRKSLGEKVIRDTEAPHPAAARVSS